MDDLLTHRQDGPVTVITFTTESLMNGADIDRAGGAIDSIVADGGPGFVLDCKKLNYLSSQALAMLINVRRKVVAKNGGKVILRGVGPLLKELLTISKLHKMFTIE